MHQFFHPHFVDSFKKNEHQKAQNEGNKYSLLYINIIFNLMP
jgi:hypothetical protein